MNLTEFRIFKNTPMKDFNNTIHFKSNAERDKFWITDQKYPTFKFSKKFNFVRDRLTVQCPIPFQQTAGYNYGTFIDDVSGVRYYFHIIEWNYVNDEVSSAKILIDVLMTWTQGKALGGHENVTINRQHLGNGYYSARLEEIKNNTDILKTYSKQYIKQKAYAWKEFTVFFQASFDLAEKFGTVSKPEVHTSNGQTYDKLTGQTNIYACAYSKFPDVMKKLQNFPWVAQSISNITLIPNSFFDAIDLKTTQLNGESQDDLKKLTASGGQSQNHLLNELATPYSELGTIFGIDLETEPHLLRSEYVTIEVYSYDGQQILVNPGKIDTVNGLRFGLVNTIGYVNQVGIYLLNNENRVGKETDVGEFKAGKFLNNAIMFNNWTELPMLIDNYKLSLSQNANQRQLAEDRLISGRVSNILDPNGFNSMEGIKSKFMDAASVLSNGLSPGAIFGKINDDYEFYRTQKAEFADLKLSTPSITAQKDGYAFQLSNDIFGLVIKFSAPTTWELNKIRSYYNSFGFEFNEQFVTDDPESMSICNYLKFKGNWNLPDVPTDQMTQLQALCEVGVRLWHYNGYTNPFEQNILSNKRVL